MGKRVLPGIVDVLTGLAAIVLVLAACISSNRIGMDFRAVFALSGIAFLTAGLLRGSPARKGYVWRLVRVVTPGLLGIAANLINNGLHRLVMPVGLMVISIFAVAVAFAARAAWPRNPQQAWTITAGALLVIAATALLVVPALSSYTAFEAGSGQIPDFNLSANGRQVSSSGMRGHVVVMAFWASWCAPCVQELPHVQRVYAHYQSDPRVTFYAVDVGWHGETADKGRQYFARRNLNLPIAFDAGDAAESLNIDAIPAIVLVDSTGRVRFTHTGYDAAENMESGLVHHIDALLAGR